jgi:Rho GDP-dissociation inhibitor
LFIIPAIYAQESFIFTNLTHGFQLWPLKPFTDADDEAMQRYKQSLGLGGSGKDLSDPNDPRHCIILSLTMDSDGRPPVTIDLSSEGAEATLKDKPFKIKEGVKFSMTAKFKVQHEILSGLHYVQIVKRKGIRVSKDQEMIVSCQLITNP